MNWTPTGNLRRWKKERDEFLAWAGQPIRPPWKRRRFARWADERRAAAAEAARSAERERRAKRLADPSPELVAAHRDLRAAEQETGGTLMCARGADFSDPETVRALARVLRQSGRRRED